MPKKLSTSAAMAIIMATALGGGLDGMGDMLGPIRKKKEKDRMPLTPEEETALACLAGKEKKTYIKMLKEKYKK
jgi:hypothetical protein